MELVTGATGYVGSRLLSRLAAEGRPVRALARDPERVEPLPGVEAVRGDLLGGAGLDAGARRVRHRLLPGALDGAGAANGGELRGARPARRRRRSRTPRWRAGVERIVYLGGIAPAGGRLAAPRSRLEVEQILLDALPGSTALRASIVIGAGSSSFRFLVRLVERLRVLPLPRWRDEPHPADRRARRDRVPRAHPGGPGGRGPLARHRGPDVVTYASLIERIAERTGRRAAPAGAAGHRSPRRRARWWPPSPASRSSSCAR